MRPLRILALLLAVLPALAIAQGEAELKRYAELDRVCEAARAKKLVPLRAQLVDQCVKAGKGARAECEQEFANYGDTHGKAGGGAMGGKFYDLPECVAATKARSQYRQ